jgi:hypothetical protein
MRSTQEKSDPWGRKKVIFAETQNIPLSSAVMKLMVIHGLDFGRKGPV